jgi:flagellin
MSGITLSAATRQSLISAQDTAALMQTTQGRLSTGKKVSSALDNPTNFFTAAGLDSRSSDLSSLLDGISNGIQTIQAASTGITNIQKLVDSAKSTANQALSATVSTNGVAGTAFAGGPTGGVTTYSDGGTATGTYTPAAQTISFTVGGASKTATILAGDDAAATAAKLTTAAGTAGVTFDATGGKIRLASTSTTSAAAAAVVISGASATGLGFTGSEIVASQSTSAVVPATTTGFTASFKVNGTAVSATIASGQTAAQTVATLNSATGVSAGTFGVDATGHITVNASSDVEITDGATKTGLGLGGGAGTQASELTVVGADTRANLATQYNALLTQIDQLASDASYNGVNLLNSADSSNKLHLAFNEKDTSNLDVQGVSAKASGLGLAAIDVTAGGTGNFATDTAVKSTITSLTNATTKLRSYASTFGSNLTVVQNRQDFTKNLTNVLQTGSAGLTNADLNEEAANSQALSTRQSLAISSLSLANTAQQGVLQLLR